MENLASQNPETTEDCYTRDDIYAQVMGPERHGRVRTLGLGISPTIVFGNKGSKASEVERREIERRHQQVLHRIRQEMEADFERKQVEIEKQIHSTLEAQMENQFQEKVTVMQAEIENKIQEKMQEKFEAYVRAMGFSMQSPQDISSGTGQVCFY